MVHTNYMKRRFAKTLNLLWRESIFSKDIIVSRTTTMHLFCTVNRNLDIAKSIIFANDCLFKQSLAKIVFDLSRFRGKIPIE